MHSPEFMMDQVSPDNQALMGKKNYSGIHPNHIKEDYTMSPLYKKHQNICFSSRSLDDCRALAVFDGYEKLTIPS